MRKILDYVEPNPAAYLEQGPKRVEIVPAVKGETILINLINTNEFYCDKKGCAFDDIAPVCGLTIAVRCEHAPASVMLEPEHIPAQYTYDGTYLHIAVDRVDIHTIIEIQINRKTVQYSVPFSFCIASLIFYSAFSPCA